MGGRMDNISLGGESSVSEISSQNVFHFCENCLLGISAFAGGEISPVEEIKVP